MIIDGQQRLTSLLLIKRGEISTGGKKRRFLNLVAEEYKEILFGSMLLKS